MIVTGNENKYKVWYNDAETMKIHSIKWFGEPFNQEGNNGV